VAEGGAVEPVGRLQKGGQVIRGLA
jgi:hypothetical protein